ncbi:LysR family transcriptional regulator [Sphingobium sp. CCH11-B1]|jgi:DNA-binding transcriptional LysR family regulator|uniref:LysR family transcriptional regulator n=1 Tax=Sphingobium sp. CCH11-B1 TaxID=1768781 RepID=UPI0008341A6D|nr:LysR family transcriptional regulator [Sphingobium sp. CCH11-B1]MEA3389410.1 LysR family transcriptional regulator [Pseudomonadota bacterium]
MLDRYLLRYFLAVVDQGNFSRAASHCNVSQPTLSVGIAKLERTVGAPLFIRSNQRVELTEAGTRFLTHARRIERAFNAAMQGMGVGDGLPSFRVGILSSVPGILVAETVAATRPGRDSRFELIFGSERELTGHLAKGRIDVALTLVGRGGDRFLEKPVRSEGYALAMSARHPLAGRASISADRLGGEVMIVRRHCEALSETSRFFTERGVRPHFALRSTNDDQVMQMVSAGLGITVMPLSFRADGMTRPALAGFDLVRTLGWAATQGAEPMLHAPAPFMLEMERRLIERT